MPVAKEGCLCLVVPSGWFVSRFDGPAHCASHLLKAVDFVIRPAQGDGWLAVEIKGAELPCNPDFDRQRYSEQLKTYTFLLDLTHKLRDSFLYAVLTDAQVAEQERYYLVMMILPEDLDEALLLGLNDRLRRELPVGVPKRCEHWERPLVRGAWVTTPAKWNARKPSWASGVELRLSPSACEGGP